MSGRCERGWTRPGQLGHLGQTQTQAIASDDLWSYLRASGLFGTPSAHPVRLVPCSATPSDSEMNGATGEELGQRLAPLCNPCHSPAAPYTPAYVWRYEAANVVDRRALGRAESGLQASSGMSSVRPQMPPELFRDRTSVDGGGRRSFADGRWAVEPARADSGCAEQAELSLDLAWLLLQTRADTSRLTLGNEPEHN